jgi:glycosyltransferase involved in cell wall biosynthesis
MGSDFVSVVVPAYNAASYLKQALESIFSQTYRNFEIIMVDDGSTDDTPIIAQQFGDAIRYIRQVNRGLSAARNTAIRNARADIIALLDSDDLWEPQFLERMICHLDLDPEAVGVYCGFQYINSKGEIVGKPSLKIVPPELFHRTIISEGNWLVPSGVVFRKRLAEDVGLFDESISPVADADLWIRLSAYSPFIGLPEALVKYRRHEGNMSKDPERMLGASFQLNEKMYGPAEGDISFWPTSKKMAYSRHYWEAAERYLASNRIQKSADYLQSIAEISPEFLCSMHVWRSLARAHVPDEYKFDSSYQLDWALIQANFKELLSELAQKANYSVALYNLYPKVEGNAFLALADEAGQAGELGRAYNWLKMVIRAYPRLLIARPFWGTIFRSITTAIKIPSQNSN